MAKTSIIIPARNETYLNRTVDDIFENATGDFEVLVMLDGWKPDNPLKWHDNLIVVYRTVPGGMRNSINNLAMQASGKWLIKSDAHCKFCKGFNELLVSGIDDDWIACPSRRRLDPAKWIYDDNPLEYQYLTFPYLKDDLYGGGFHGKKWIGEDGIGRNNGRSEYYWKENSRKDVLIDDVLTMQGSCWAMTKDHYMRIGMEDEKHSSFYQECNELCFKTWMIGGRCVVNKNSVYGHWHKDVPQGYGFRKSDKHETERFHAWVWMNDKWPKAIHRMEWFVDKFSPLPGWPADWKSYVKEDGDFRIFNENGHDGFF